MARIDNLENFLEDVAISIKTKKQYPEGTKIPAESFDTEIDSIELKGKYQDKNITIDSNGNYTIVPDGEYDALNSLELTVDVNGEPLEDTTATINDVIAPETFYSNGEYLTGAIKTERKKETVEAVYTVNTNDISDISSDNLYRAYASGSTLYVQNVITGSVVNTRAISPSMTSVRFSPLILERGGRKHYMVFGGGCRHDSDIVGIAVIHFSTNIDGTNLIVDQSFSTTLTVASWEGSGVVLYPNINRQNIVALCTSNRNVACGARIYMVQVLENNTVIQYNYNTTLNTGETLNIVGEWSGDTFYATYPNNSYTQYKVQMIFNGETLAGIQGTNKGTNITNRSYTLAHYMEYGTLYDLSGVVLRTYEEISGPVMVSTVNNDYLNVLALQNGFLDIFHINLATLDITLEQRYNCTKTNWTITSGNANLCDKTRIKLSYNGNGIMYIMSLSEQNIIIAMTRLGTTYYDTSDADARPEDILVGTKAMTSTGMIVGSMPNNGELHYNMTGEQQIIPAGYTSGGIIEGGTLVHNQDISVTKNGTYTAEDGYTGLGEVTVMVPQASTLYFYAPAVDTPEEANYGFELVEDGFFESTNKGVQASFAYALVTLDLKEDTNVIMECISYGESGYDYGIVSKIDSILSYSYNNDSSEIVQKSFYGESSPDIKTVDFGIVPAGIHFITVKYRKDGSVDQYSDSFKFRFNIPLPTVEQRYEVIGFASLEEMYAYESPKQFNLALVYDASTNYIFLYNRGEWVDITHRDIPRNEYSECLALCDWILTDPNVKKEEV